MVEQLPPGITATQKPKGPVADGGLDEKCRFQGGRVTTPDITYVRMVKRWSGNALTHTLSGDRDKAIGEDNVENIQELLHSLALYPMTRLNGFVTPDEELKSMMLT
ncbi:hypothetical protein GMORB2_0309 [Geosmithia morbida]|uniref:Uncharacterized protein n=1 Tax=Geosmithia morbida TaxID=1094350 RepID=A0A9P5D3T8_9HYPO|nr:uncharacterized protein GMORB2_0309 [Geosmithia morbida]KAF4126573.1 hypothetical protein GMORB2_0309 [Geosmithia morbida]